MLRKKTYVGNFPHRLTETDQSVSMNFFRLSVVKIHQGLLFIDGFPTSIVAALSFKDKCHEGRRKLVVVPINIDAVHSVDSTIRQSLRKRIV